MDELVPRYPTDLTDSEWKVLSEFVPAEKPIGADRRTSMRAVINAIFYRSRSGCSWRMLPREFPHWRTVYGYYCQWLEDGTWKRIERLHRRMRRRCREFENSRACGEDRAANNHGSPSSYGILEG
jgi:putative transposase